MYMATSINGGPVTWEAYATPTTPTTVFLTHLGITTIVASGIRFVVVGGVAQGTFWRWARLASGGTASWSSVGGLYWTAQSGLVATNSPSEQYAEFFVAHTPANPGVGVIRWNGSFWASADIGHPVGQTCAPAAVVQGSFAVPASGYRLTLACTNTNGTFHLATSPAANSNVFAWTSYSINAPAAFPSVAGAVREGGTPSQLVHELFYATSVNSLIKIELSPTTEAFTDIGGMRDIDLFSGGIAIAPRASESRIFYLGNTSGSSRLFERLGRTTNGPTDYRWLGSASTSSYWPAPSHAAEGKLAGWKGTEALAMIERPGLNPNDWPSVYLMFTQTQNEPTNLSTSRPVTKNLLINGAMQMHPYVSDPTVVMTDGKKAYSFQIGVQMSACAPSSLITRATIYMVSTLDGITHSAPYIITSSATNSSVPPLDHPWADIQHVPGTNDIIHLAWYDIAISRVRYARFTENVGLGPIYNLPAGTVGPPRITVSDGGRAVVYTGDSLGNVKICEINSTNTGCTTQGWQSPTTYFSHNVQVVPNMSAIEAVAPISMIVSEGDSNVLYFCADVQESNLVNSDVKCGRIRRDANGAWTIQASAIVNSTANDGKDQFLPEVMTTSESDGYSPVQETVMATWYDRTNSPTNYYYQTMKTVSIDGASSFAPPLLGSAVYSDPEFLPRHCRKPTVRFAGDYNAVEGDLLHKNVPAVVVPSGATQPTTQVFSFPIGLGSWSN